jgi:mRNA interferase MazF
MGVFNKGEVVTLPFPFTDMSNAKVRPALVLATPSEENFLVLSAPKVDELIVCQITKQPSRTEFAIPLLKSDFARGGLRHNSFIRPNHIFTAEPKLVISSVGILKPDKLREVLDATINILRGK